MYVYRKILPVLHQCAYLPIVLEYAAYSPVTATRDVTAADTYHRTNRCTTVKCKSTIYYRSQPPKNIFGRYLLQHHYVGTSLCYIFLNG